MAKMATKKRVPRRADPFSVDFVPMHKGKRKARAKMNSHDIRYLQNMDLKFTRLNRYFWMHAHKIKITIAIIGSYAGYAIFTNGEQRLRSDRKEASPSWVNLFQPTRNRLKRGRNLIGSGPAGLGHLFSSPARASQHFGGRFNQISRGVTIGKIF